MDEHDEHNEHNEQDSYVEQLRCVFDSCDADGSGYLDRNGIALLCQRLQLDERAPFFLQHLVKDDPHPMINFHDFKDEFISLLTQSIGPPETSPNVASPEREISPKYVHGNKKYGRRSQPESQESGSGNDADTSDPEVFGSENDAYPGSEVDPSCSEAEVMDHDGVNYSTNSSFPPKNNKSFIKRKRRSNSDSKLYPSKLEENEPEFLRDIWRTLAVGADGFLDLLELERVCEHMGMEKMSQEVVRQLFSKVDTDHDGKISFDEFLNLFHGSDSGVPSFAASVSSPKKIAIWNDKSADELKALDPAADDRCEMTMLTAAESGMFSSLDPENQGIAVVDAIVDLWESLGFPNGQQILKDLGINMSPSINLQDLSRSLEEVMVSCDDSVLRRVATATINFELQNLRNSLDQLRTERTKLKGDISEANVRTSLLAQEIDDQNSKLEKSSQRNILMLDKKYKEQTQTLMEEHQKEKEALTTKIVKLQQQETDEIKHLKEEENFLQNKVETLQKDNARLESEIRDLHEKLEENEKLNQRHQKDVESLLVLQQKLEELESGETVQQIKYHSLLSEMESLKLENQKLRDCNDELVLKIESLQQQLVSRPPARPAASHKRNGSWLGEYVQNPASKRRGAHPNVLLENSVEYAAAPTGKICRPLDMSSEDCSSEMDQLEDSYDVP